MIPLRKIYIQEQDNCWFWSYAYYSTDAWYSEDAWHLEEESYRLYLWYRIKPFIVVTEDTYQWPKDACQGEDAPQVADACQLS